MRAVAAASWLSACWTSGLRSTKLDVAHEGRRDKPPRRLRGEQMGAGGLGGAPEPAPEIDLPEQIERPQRGESLSELTRRPVAGDVRVGRARRAAEIGELERAVER